MLIVYVIFLCLLLSSSALLSASETSLFSLSSHTMRTYRVSPDTRQNLIAHLMARPRDVLVTILILNIFSNILVQNTVANLFGNLSSWALKVLLPLALTLFLGEVFPKSIALTNNSRIAYRVAPFISRIARWIAPIREPLTKWTSWISRILFFFLKEEPLVTSHELRHVLKVSEERGVLLSEETDFVVGLLDLQKRAVKERMRPREEILFYNIEDPIEKLVMLFSEKQVTRVPVSRGSVENLLGILPLSTFFAVKEEIVKGEDLLSHLKKPYYVPETTKAWTLLHHMRKREESLAMVVDEYGSISGLIAQEDLFETVVGKIQDTKEEKSLYTRASEDILIASGKLELAEFERIFHITLETKEPVVTLGGWLMAELGDIPVTGAKYATDQFLFYILAADPQRIRRIYVRRLGKKR